MPVMSGSLRWLGYRRTLRWVERASHPSDHIDAPSLEQADRMARLAAIAGRHAAVEATCLRQALAVLLMLRRRGASPALKFGVDLKAATPDMHAWLEMDGQPLGQADLRHRPFHR